MSQQRVAPGIDVSADELRRRVNEAPLNDEDRQLFVALVDTVAQLIQELEAKRVSIDRLRRLVFGGRTEKLRNLKTADQAVGDPQSSAGETTEPSPARGACEDNNTDADSSREDSQTDDPKRKPKVKAKGHGRHGAKDYPGAEQRDIPHPSLHHGDTCPDCCQGKLCDLSPVVHLRFSGAAPITAKRTQCGRLRCCLCGEVFTADAPDDIKDEKYDDAATAIVALLKYDSAMPFNRLARLQSCTGIPLAASTQWELCEKMGIRALPVFIALIRYAAQAGLIHMDDTPAKILGPVRRSGESASEALERVTRAQSRDPQLLPIQPSRPQTRTGTFTSGMVAEVDGHSIVLYQTGWRHAGDNLELLLSHRNPELEAPIQMCDALSRNMSGDFKTIVANCLAHGRREFADLVHVFGEQSLHVIRQLASVYHNDSEAKSRGLSSEQRLAWHQQHSAPIMAALQNWMKTEVDERRIEPNSRLGSAIKYMERHWSELTLFLRVAGAPLDNNVCERILKRAILHRKNALFFRTQRGAIIADICMSLIQTTELSKKNSLHYLTSLLEHHELVAKDPMDWLPWNYEETLALRLSTAA